MKKRTILALLALVFVYVAMASPVDPQRAMQVAKQFVPQPSVQKAPGRGTKDEASSTIVYTHMMPNSDRPAFYIVNVEDGAFVLVSADDIAHQILGYSFNKSWPVAKDGTIEIPEHIKGFFDDLAAQMEAAIEANPNRAPESSWTNSRPATRRSNPELPDSVGPLLTTTWDQGQYYNALCPEDADGPGGHALTGCVATAMAQIVNYWSDSIPIGRGIHSYETNYGTLEVNYENETYNFANMPALLNETSVQEQISAVAKLIYNCGVATNMRYGASESSAYDVDARAGLINFFRFSPDINYAKRNAFSSEEWNNLLRKDIASNHPIIYSGYGESGGHSFICDGYKADDFYHFNFGWGGLADGWYLTSAVCPLNVEFNSSQNAILNIVPDKNGNVIYGQYIGKSTYVVDEPLFFLNPYYSVYEENKNIVSFISPEEQGRLVCDILDFDESVIQYININQWYRKITYNDFGNNDYSSIETNDNSLTFDIMGLFDSGNGFKFYIRKDDGNRLVSSISLNNVNDGTGTSINVAWDDASNSDIWQIRYRAYGTPVDSATIINVSTNPYTITGLSKGEMYYFSVRNQSGIDANIWGIEYSAIVDLPHWTDVVTEQPSGYIEDSEGNVYITTPEGLAWISVKSNGLHNQSKDDYTNKIIHIKEDIDLSGYRWLPIACNIATYTEVDFQGIFDGENHTISNMYITEDKTERCGLFAFVRGGEIKNVTIKNGVVNNFYYSIPEQSASGGLVGQLIGGKINNCHTSLVVKGLQAIGGLCGYSTGTIINSLSSGDLFGRAMCGGLLGHAAPGSKIINCYSNSNIWSNNSVEPLYCTAYRAYRGGLIGYAENSIIENCFATGKVESETGSYTSGTVVGCPCYNSELKYVYGLLCDELNISGYNEDGLVVVDTSSFILRNDTCVLLTHVSVKGFDYSDMIEAMNAWIIEKNNPSYRIWKKDSTNINNGYPIFGDYFEPKCYNPTNLTVSNATIAGDSIIQTKFAWYQIGNPDKWEILYVPARHNVDEGVIISVNSNPCILTEIPVRNPLDFYVRAISAEADTSGWSDPITYIPDKLHWTDVVTSQPEGYQVDANGIIHIYSAEGLAWLAHIVNNTFEERTVYLEANINLGQYRWDPIGYGIIDGLWCPFWGEFDGKGHTIEGLYCNELKENLGLFGLGGGTIQNLFINNCQVYGISRVGAIAGCAPNGSKITNCGASGIIGAWALAGGLIGEGPSDTIKNSYYNGSIVYREDMYSYYIPGYFGGIASYSYNSTIENCYFSGDMPNMGYSGLITGSGVKPYSVANCYSLYDSSGIPFITYNILTSNLSFFTGSDYKWTLNTPPTINGTTYSDLVDALNAWVDANNANGEYRHWVADTTYVNGGFPIIAPIPGDVNDDGIVDISDYIGVANYILGHAPDGFNETAADVNNDGIIDISDYIGVANIILKGEP